MKKLVVILPLMLASIVGSLASTQQAFATAANKLGDLASFQTIANDTLSLVDKGDLASAQKRITDFETAWDRAEPDLYPKDKTAWGAIDDAADGAISSLRAAKPSKSKAHAAVQDLISSINRQNTL